MRLRTILFIIIVTFLLIMAGDGIMINIAALHGNVHAQKALGMIP